jgi:arylsulfatase A-like enzyme
LIVWKSGNPLGGRTSTALVSSVDVAPTILDWANIEIPDSMEGASLWPLIHDPAAPRRTALFGAISIPPGKRRSAAGNQVYALYVRTDQWKYITYLKDLSHTEARKAGYPTDRGRKGFRRAGEEELYDLSKDPYEEENLAALPEHREQLETLRRNVFEWWRSRDESDLPRLDAKQNDPQPLRTRPNRRNRSQKPKSEEESNE